MKTHAQTLAGALLLLVGAVWLTAPAAHAAGVVGTGTPASCTEAALDTALVGGGSVTFNCGPAPAAIIVSATKTPTGTTTVDGGGLITLSGGNGVQVFKVNAGRTLILNNLTVTRGLGLTGGCLLNAGTLDLTNTVVEQCAATQDGGGLYNDAGGHLTITNSVVRSNTAQRDCGGICDYGLSVTVTASEISENKAMTGSGGGVGSAGTTMSLTTTSVINNSAVNSNGGGLYNTASMTVTDVTVSHNSAVQGGGLSSLVGTAALSRTTVAQNSATYGGGMYVNSGTVTLTNVTISTNTADVGPALNNAFGHVTLANATVSGNPSNTTGAIEAGQSFTTFLNTILSNPTANGNCSSFYGDVPFISSGFNIASDTTCHLVQSSDTRSTDPMLGLLAHNGGPTPTQRLLPGSPAIDTGTGAGCPLTDQRGVPRPQGLACDIGAYEVAVFDLAVSQMVPGVVTLGHQFADTITVQNLGTGLAQVVTLTDPLPPGASLVSVTSSQGTCTGSTTVTCLLGKLAGGASATVTLVVTATSVGTLSNTASVTAVDVDTNLANNTTTAMTVVGSPPLDVQLNQASFRAGDELRLTVTLNPGAAPMPPLVDAYVVLRLVDGSFLSLTLAGGMVPGLVPIAQGFPPIPVTGLLFRYVFTGAEAFGEYAFFAGLTQTGTLTLIGAVDEEEFTVGP
jgi:uncharacterized repeat protein (TIGR01451 family)